MVKHFVLTSTTRTRKTNILVYCCRGWPLKHAATRSKLLSDVGVPPEFESDPLLAASMTDVLPVLLSRSL